MGVDVAQFTAELDRGLYRALIEADIEEGRRAGVDGTPTFFINGQELPEPTLDGFKSLIDETLKEVARKPAR